MSAGVKGSALPSKTGGGGGRGVGEEIKAVTFCTCGTEAKCWTFLNPRPRGQSRKRRDIRRGGEMTGQCPQQLCVEDNTALQVDEREEEK